MHIRACVVLAATLTGCTPMMAAGPTGAGPARGGKGDGLTEDDRARIQSMVCEALDPMLAASEGLGASLGVLRDGRLVWSGGCGNVGGAPQDPFDNVSAEGVAADGETVWPVSSISKIVMAVAVLQVVERMAWAEANDRDEFVTKLNEILDREANTLLVGGDDSLYFHHMQSETQVTLRMLLTHTSGLSDNYRISAHNVPVSWPNYDDESPLDLHDSLVANLDNGNANYGNSFLAHGPGGGYQYTSTWSSAASLLVDVQEGTSFQSYTQSNIFDYLGMSDTSWRLSWLRSEQRDDDLLNNGRYLGLPVKKRNVTIGEGDEQRTEARWVRASDCGTNGSTDCAFWEHTFYPAASLRSTVHDFARFLSPLMQGGIDGELKLLEHETLIEAFDGEQTATHYGLNSGNNSYQGLIFYWGRYDGDWYVCHAGRNTGYTSNACFKPEEWRSSQGDMLRAEGSQWGVIVFSNADGPGRFQDAATTYLFQQTKEGGLFADL